MSKLYAVSCMDFFYNNLTTEFHRGDCWRDALMQHSQTTWCDDSEADLRVQELGEAKDAAFNADWLFDVVEVPTNA